MDKKSIVYIMNVDWFWIKQRPHFIAELLNEKFDVHVIFQYRYNRKGFQQASVSNINLNPVYVIPKGDRSYLGRMINKKIKSSVVKRIIKRVNANIIYLTYPNQVELIPAGFNGTVIYDCMDDHPAFVSNDIDRNNMIMQEEKLINNADCVFISSEHLGDVLNKRYDINKLENKLHLIRNGYNGEVIKKKEITTQKNKTYTFAYFGTISNWFNFDFILRSLDDFSNLQYELYGPVAGIDIPQHQRIHYHGTVEHDKLYDNIKHVDCLIMPFIVNDIIESVDPVKLYEYINFNKNILVSYYKEIDRFDKFVYFYNNYDGFSSQISKLMNTNKVKYNELDRQNFLSKNSWKCRTEEIIDIINKVN